MLNQSKMFVVSTVALIVCHVLQLLILHIVETYVLTLYDLIDPNPTATPNSTSLGRAVITLQLSHHLQNYILSILPKS